MAPRKPAAAPAVPKPRRSARIAAPNASPETPAHRVAKRPKAAKPKSQRYECTTCSRTLAGSSFPQYLATDNCKHLINTCKQCSKAWIAAQLESTTYDKVSCPECPEVMSNAGVKELAAKEVYAKYEEIERREKVKNIPGWRWCMNSYVYRWLSMGLSGLF